MTSRTSLQNRALHKYFKILADELNSAGLDMRKTLREDWEIPWTPEMVKEHIWRPVQKVMTEKQSTTELDTVDINEIYKVIDRHLSQSKGISTPFPNDQEE